jgi:anti-sigma regulatory factor (Ser/Thr protein kinase)
MAKVGYPKTQIFAVRLALEEAVANAYKHAHDSDWKMPIAVRYYIGAQDLVVQVKDRGTGFEPACVADPLAPENLERASGRGLFLMRKYMTRVCHNAQGNCVCLCKHLPGAANTCPAAARCQSELLARDNEKPHWPTSLFFLPGLGTTPASPQIAGKVCSLTKVRLVVANVRGQGKVIPVAVSPFLIGRNAVCQLRPTSPFVSNRHCTLWLRDGAVFVQDMGSTNGTLVNDVQIAGEKKLQDGDRLQVGPLVFDVRIETPPAINQPTPLAPIQNLSVPTAPDDAAAMILLEGSAEPAPCGPMDSSGVPLGDTKLAVPDKEKPSRNGDGLKSQQDTAAAAGEILKQYMRRLKSGYLE